MVVFVQHRQGYRVRPSPHSGGGGDQGEHPQTLTCEGNICGLVELKHGSEVDHYSCLRQHACVCILHNGSVAHSCTCDIMP
jgi:hypothetical protein